MKKDFELTFRIREAMEVFENVAKMHAITAYHRGLKDPACILAALVDARKYTRLAIRTGFDWRPHELDKDVLRFLTLHYEHVYLTEFEQRNKNRTIHVDKYAGKETETNKPN